MLDVSAVAGHGAELAELLFLIMEKRKFRQALLSYGRSYCNILYVISYGKVYKYKMLVLKELIFLFLSVMKKETG